MPNDLLSAPVGLVAGLVAPPVSGTSFFGASAISTLFRFVTRFHASRSFRVMAGIQVTEGPESRTLLGKIRPVHGTLVPGAFYVVRHGLGWLKNFRGEAGCGFSFVLDKPMPQLSARFHAKLAENAREVVLDGVFAHAGKDRDLAIGPARFHPLRDFLLAHAQIREACRKSGVDVEQPDHAAEHLMHDGHELLERFDVRRAELPGNAVKAVIGPDAALGVVYSVGGSVSHTADAKALEPRRRHIGPRPIGLEELRFSCRKPAAQHGRVDRAGAVAYPLQVGRRIIDRHDVVERDAAGVQVAVAARERSVGEDGPDRLSRPGLVLLEGLDAVRFKRD